MLTLTTIGSNDMKKRPRKGYTPAKVRIKLSVGESVRIMRELQEMSQMELSKKAGMPQATISAIENNRIALGVERAKVLARALRCHPAILAFPGWELEQERRVA